MSFGREIVSQKRLESSNAFPYTRSRAGEYSEGFVSEFKIFYRELSDFFSASSLTDSLLAIKVGLDNDAEHQVSS